VEQAKLNQFGSNYPEELYSPVAKEGTYFEQIYREQNRMLAKIQAKKKAAKAAAAANGLPTAVPVVRQSSAGSVGLNISGSAGFGSRTDEPAAKRSKWGNAPTASSGNALADFKRFQAS